MRESDGTSITCGETEGFLRKLGFANRENGKSERINTLSAFLTLLSPIPSTVSKKLEISNLRPCSRDDAAIQIDDPQKSEQLIISELVQKAK